MAEPPRPRVTEQGLALLPEGLHDVLPPQAAQEARLVETMLARFGANGFERVKPPLVEFDENLLSGFGAALADRTFRMVDPLSQRMLAVRPDITMQIARLALSRLANRPRPLRLSYRGEVLRVRGSQLRPERQFVQIGCETFGALEPMADAELLLLAVRALQAVGITGVSVDLTVPTLVPVLLDALDADAETRAILHRAIDARDREAAARAGPAGQAIAHLLSASGRVETALAGLRNLALPDAAMADRDRLEAVVKLVRAREPALMLTVDLVEQRGFEYQTGLSYALFARDVRGELGRGGRYRAGAGLSQDRPDGEPAAGFTLYVDTLLRAAPRGEAPPRLWLPADTSDDVALRLQDQGWVTVAGLTPVADAAAEARRLGCHAYWQGDIIRLD